MRKDRDMVQHWTGRIWNDSWLPYIDIVLYSFLQSRPAILSSSSTNDVLGFYSGKTGHILTTSCNGEVYLFHSGPLMAGIPSPKLIQKKRGAQSDPKFKS